MNPLTYARLASERLISVIRAPSWKAAAGAADAVAKGGVPIVEVTFTVPEALKAMEALGARTDLILGAGTVLTAQQGKDAIAAGARFIVAPNVSAEVARVARDAGVLYLPGAYTTNEILAARAAGADVVKVYPVGVAGGPRYIEVIKDPLPDIPFLAAGGTSLDNLIPFLDVGCVAVGVGGAIADPALAAAGDFAEITRRAQAFARRLHERDSATAAASPR